MITVDVKITPTDIPNKIARVEASFVDDIELSTTTVSMQSADLSSGPKQLEAMDIIWSKYQEAVAHEMLIVGVVGTLEADAKANLEARL